jgi:hypothetical protein
VVVANGRLFIVLALIRSPVNRLGMTARSPWRRIRRENRAHGRPSDRSLDWDQIPQAGTSWPIRFSGHGPMGFTTIDGSVLVAFCVQNQSLYV